MKADRGFALTRCGSKGDSNCRSSLAFFVLWKRPESPAVFGQNFPVDRSENNSLVGFSAVTPLKVRVFLQALKPQRAPAVRIPFAPATRHWEPPVSAD